MTIVGALAILLGFLIYPFAVIQRTATNISLFFLTYIAHVGSSIVFYLYVQDAISDSHAYYFDPRGFSDSGFGVGTQFIFFLTKMIKDASGGTYLDLFLVYQTFGFLAVAALMRMTQEIFGKVGENRPVALYFLMFLPGLHFWTSALGKDALIVPAICLAAWAVSDLRNRRLILVGSIALMFLVRPHVALLCAVSLAASLMWGSRVGATTKVLMFVGSLGVIAFSATIVQSTFAVDVTSVDSVSDFLASHEAVTSTMDESATSVRGGLMFRGFSLLFRPLFIDAGGIFGSIASAENVILLIMFGFLIWHWREVVDLVKRVVFIRFVALFAAMLIVFLSLINYNIGLSLRQKMMIIPLIIIIVAAVAAMRKFKSAPGRSAVVRCPVRSTGT